MAPTNSSAFAKDEKVFCFHHELLYEARVLDVRKVDEKDKNSPYEYMIHYKGWKNTWDDWVPQDRLRKLTDEYRELASNLKKDLINQDARRQPLQAKGTIKKGGKDTERGSEDRNSAAPTGKGRRKEKDTEIESMSSNPPSTPTPIPHGQGEGFSMEDLGAWLETSSSDTRSDTTQMDFFGMDAALGHQPPPDPPEYVSARTFDLGLPCAPCISGTLVSEQEIMMQGGDAVMLSNGHPPVRVPNPFRTQEMLDRSRAQWHHIPLYAPKPPRDDEKALEEWYKARAAPIPRCRPDPYKAVEAVICCSSDPTGADLTAKLQEEHFMSKPSINMHIPDTIKGYLVDDWEYVTKNYQLVPLPSENPVNWIMDEYFNQEKVNRRLGSPEAQMLEEVRVGIKEWFKRALGKTLLYKFEREQYSDVSAWWENVTDPKDKWYGRGVGDCYGIEHLLRLLVKIPEYIAHTNMDAQSINTMRRELDHFMNWLARNAPELMCKEYNPATQEYIERATGSTGR